MPASPLWPTWRWFGPADRVSVADACQAGARGIVATVDLPAGAPWPTAAIARRAAEVRAAGTGLEWQVVESLPVSEDIKLREGDHRRHLDSYRTSLANLASSGLSVVCYNFMPVLDWTRTELRHQLPNGGTAMRFDLVRFAAFDIHVLGREDAAASYPADVALAAGRLAASLDEAGRDGLAHDVLAGLPGSVESWTLATVREHLARYRGVTAAELRDSLHEFVAAVADVAAAHGVHLAIHPDDPPFPLLGLPRVMSTAADCAALLAAVPEPANGLTLCTGSYGAHPGNDLPAMARRFGDRIHFAHLRNVTRDADTVPCSFLEDDHLAGGTDMVAVVRELLAAAATRPSLPLPGGLPFRPDHGHELLDDLGRQAQPGYPAIGRLKGLAQLEGVISALRA